MENNKQPLTDELFSNFFEQTDLESYKADFENQETLEKARKNNTIDEIIEEVESKLQEAVDDYCSYLETEKKLELL